MRQGLDDGDVDAERLPDGGELDTDHAAAEDDGRLRDAVELEGVVRGDDAVAVDLQARDRARHGAGGQEDVAALDALAVDVHRGLRGELALTLDEGHLAGRHQALEALVQAGDDVVLVLVDAVDVDALEGGQHAELGGLLRLVGDLGRVQQRLGRDAAAVQAGAAELALLDQGDAQAQLGAAERRGVTAASASENDYVENGAGVVRHVTSSMQWDVDRRAGRGPVGRKPLWGAQSCRKYIFALVRGG